MTAPLYEHLSGYASKNRISFAMPGHKNGRGLDKNLLSLDVTELAQTENLYGGGKYVKEANRLLSELYGSGESLILTGGSTAALQAMICGAVKRGGVLLAAADCHVSVTNTCALLGIRIRFFPKEIDPVTGIPQKTVSVAKYLSGDVDAVIVTSPNYYGVCCDVKNIARECHEKNIPLLVDEAHGAHFASSVDFPETAVHFADAVCHSAHKTLNAMNGAAYLHLCGNIIDRTRAKQAVTMFQSTSPSYVIASSADLARDEMSGADTWKRTRDMCAAFRERAMEIGISVPQNDDITRVVLNFSHYDTTGFFISDELSRRGIDVEMADIFNVVLIVTPSNTSDDIKRLSDALCDIMKNASHPSRAAQIPMPPSCADTLSPSDAFWSGHVEVGLNDAEGYISRAAIVPYPPGIPAVYCGQVIRAENIEYIKAIVRAGGEVSGLNDGKITVVSPSHRSENGDRHE